MGTDTDTDTLTAATSWATTEGPRFERELCELLRIPSISTQPDHAADCVRAAEFLADDMRRVGLEHVAVMGTPGHPVVYADWLHAGEDAPTVLVYGHYDVQPPDPLDEWHTPPFEPALPGDGNVYARGAADDKGQLFVHLKSVEACLAACGTLPVNVRFLLEGEEESGSEHLEPFVAEHAQLLAADVCVISDSHMMAADQPSIVSSLRGMTYCQIDVQGPAHDLHSGTFGGAVRNPAEALAQILAQLKDADGRILVPGFYGDVVELSADDRAELARVPFSAESFRRDAGIDATFGEAGYSVYEQVGARPTLEINGMVSGYIGEGAKTVLPARAMAKVSMRLVANQRWRDVTEKFRTFVESLAPSGVRVTVSALHGGEPSMVDVHAPAMRAASAALERVFGATPVFSREGGSIPVVAVFDEQLDIPTVLMGFGLPDDRLHSPNEKFSLAQFHKGVAASIAFWHELARVGTS
jgi:acetylornithine deacetylase/succinyl-diaminopimelate desuccinylase-like protein